MCKIDQILSGTACATPADMMERAIEQAAARVSDVSPSILRNFPHSRRNPAVGNGRVQRQVMAAFALIGKPVLTTSEVLSFAYGHLELLGERPRRWHYKHVRDVCR